MMPSKCSAIDGRRTILGKMAIGLTLFWVIAAPLSSNAQCPLFINETYYDNTFTDTGECVEIAGDVCADMTARKCCVTTKMGRCVILM